MPDLTCSIASCERALYLNSYCRTHYHRDRVHGDPLWMPSCSVDGCEQPFVAKGYCKPHYHRWKKTGNPLAVLSRDLTDIERFHTHVSVESNGCWRWTSGVNIGGYGKFWVKNRTVGAHRFAYSALVGEIPEGMEIDHFRFPQDGCIGASCVNPEHLRPVTSWENVLRSNSPVAMNKAKEFCKRGHELTPENTLVRPDGRRCRICRLNDQRRTRARRIRLRC